MRLTEFLLARIAEDEAWAESGLHGEQHKPYGRTEPDDPARVLAECESKRDIIGFVLAAESGIEQLRPDDRAMRALALPHADHPDYQPEWRP